MKNSEKVAFDWLRPRMSEGHPCFQPWLEDLTSFVEKVRQDALTDAWNAAQSAHALLLAGEPYSESELEFLKGIDRASDMIQVYRKA